MGLEFFETMSSKAKPNTGMLSQYLHERYGVCEEHLSKKNSFGRCNSADKAVEELDKYMQAITDRDILQGARQEQESTVVC